MRLICRSLYIFIVILTVVRPACVQGQGSPGSSSAAGLTDQGTPSVRAVPVQSSITVDGRLDESVWQTADPATGFRQYRPDEGAPATQRTEVRVLYGENDIYIGASLYTDSPANVEQALGRRDDYNRADWFVVSIDSYLDRQTAYSFGVSAAGVQLDAVYTGGGRGPLDGMDESWDAVWYSDVRVTSEGWFAEMRIPYSMLRFSEAESQTWGIHFRRRIPRIGEEAEWPLIPSTERENLVARFGRLHGIVGVEPKRNLQIRPYSMTRVQTEESAEVPGELAHASSLDVGGDVKVGLGPNATLDATINPDFGQVESDPAVLNLTAFETFYTERRPFFVESGQIYEFDVGPGQLLYTRRIGADGPIIGAAKVSGRTGSGLSFGLLGAATGNDFDPVRQYAVARASQQIGSYSSAGGIVTYFDGTDADPVGRGRSVAGGADWDFRLLENRYGIEGFAAMTHRGAAKGAQDPEAGMAGEVWLRKRQGAWTGFVGGAVFSDRFNPNDLGQLRENNFIALYSRTEYEINGGRSFGPFLRASADAFGIQQFSYDQGLNLGQSVRVGSRWTLRSFQQIGLGASVQNVFGGYDLYETRGLGPWAEPLSFGVEGEIETDDRRDWEVEPELGVEFQENGGRGFELGLRGNWNIGTRLSLSGNVEGAWEDDQLAWSSNETFLRGEDGWMIGRTGGLVDADPADMVAFDDEGLLDAILTDVAPHDTDRFFVPIFGVRDTRSLDLTLRGTVTFIPNLSLQLYSQLFLARGRYDQFQILQSPDDLAPFDAFPKRDDFALNSLQSNVVLRWEYRPGSTLFLVWTHGRRAEDVLNPLAPRDASPFEQQFSEQFVDTFRLFPSNVLLVKLNYTFLY